MFRVRVRGRSAAMHLMVCIVVAMFSPFAPMFGLKTDAIAILVTCKLGSLVWCCSPDEWNHACFIDVLSKELCITVRRLRRRVQCTCQCIVGMQMTERVRFGKAYVALDHLDSGSPNWFGSAHVAPCGCVDECLDGSTIGVRTRGQNLPVHRKSVSAFLYDSAFANSEKNWSRRRKLYVLCASIE
ncbi:hypothetical protein EDB86DRAFT_1699421 [Lactarius hatsudake]|nr:hypothetical protein EDB86DRAFT_1699421 [Lactarius hatsudake]